MHTDPIQFYDLEFSSQELSTLGKVLVASQEILIVSHRNPDGDTVGAGCALACTLSTIGKDVELFCIDPIPQKFQFMAAAHHYTQILPAKIFDLIILVDTSSLAMSGIEEFLTTHQEKLVVIDHHRSSTNPGTINIINQDSCSTTALLYCILYLLNLPICLDTATALLEGIYWDTGSFKHSNTTFHTYRIASELLALGADPELITRNIFSSTPLQQLQLWGEVLKSIQQSERSGISFSILTQEMLEKCNARTEDAAGVIDFLNSIPHQPFSLLLTEEESGLRASLRSQQPNIDLSKIVKHFGGGGHAQAAGFSMHGKLSKEYHWSISPVF